jgi:3',5'-cyclic AMP phosphodiesterase CpdA
MEIQLNNKVVLFIAISLAACSCAKDQEDYSANQRFIQSTDWNKMNETNEIVVFSEEYNILSIADIHVGGTTNLDSFYRIAKSKKATAVVMAGDLTTGNQEDYVTFEQHIPLEYPIPLFFLTGNHDLHYGGWKEFYSMFGSSTYTFSVKTPSSNDLFICLDTGGGTLGDLQMEWLINILKTTRPSYRHCMVFTHNNIFRTRHTDSTNPVIEELEVLVDIFTRYNVDMVITGHDHRHDDVLFGNTRYIVIDALKDGLENAGYFQINVIKTGFSYSFEKI